ncbi:class C sortase [Vagococcus sp. DIV0080]|uniref:Class C sortase n=1 Tax=Candidatus Vagococcus giribetii TaxID=2230876 RepID=A0ABS3HQS7_9ENTE|nr:class C sortase [Vagococcus sp. DIV0080]MBO0476113.1 class C sortase [Vagococcus sp. DIV0080]
MKSDKTGIWLKIAITLTFVLGALIFLYPFVANIINTQVDKHRIEALQQQTKQEEEVQLAEKKRREEEIKKNPHLGMKLEEDLFDEVDQSSQLGLAEIKKHLIGSISIPKINSELPIFDVTTPSFLQEGVTLLPGASYPSGGKGTHAVLTGHTGLPNKKLFTDLKDVVEGDKIYLKVLGETLAYEVDQIKVVLPDQLDDLNVEKDKDYLTLVTCTPYMVNTHRLLVRGKRVPINLQEVKRADKQIDQKNKRLLAFYGLLIALLIGLLIAVMYRQYLNYMIMRKRYRISFTCYKNGKPLKNKTFVLMDRSKRHKVKRGKRRIKGTSNSRGKVVMKGIRGGHYWLVATDSGKKEPIVIKCWVKRPTDRRFRVKLSPKSSTMVSIKESQGKRRI